MSTHSHSKATSSNIEKASRFCSCLDSGFDCFCHLPVPLGVSPKSAVTWVRVFSTARIDYPDGGLTDWCLNYGQPDAGASCDLGGLREDRVDDSGKNSVSKQVWVAGEYRDEQCETFSEGVKEEGKVEDGVFECYPTFRNEDRVARLVLKRSRMLESVKEEEGEEQGNVERFQFLWT